MKDFMRRLGTGMLGALIVLVLLGAVPQDLHDELGGLIYFFPSSHSDGIFRNDGSGNVSFEDPVPPELLGSGTPTSDLFLRGDSTWATLTALEEPLPAGMIMLFESTCPSGWTRYSALDGRFPRGASTSGGTGGSSSHSHTVDSHSHGDGTLAVASHSHGAGTLAGGSHSHGSGTLTGDSHLHSVDPPNTTSTNTSNNHDHQLQSGIGIGVTSGSDATAACAGATCFTGGQSTSHSHDVNIGSFNSGSAGVGVSGSTASSSVGISGSTGSAAPDVTGSTASASPGTNSPSHLPPYLDLVFCRKS